jgi:hypothetical protein
MNIDETIRRAGARVERGQSRGPSLVGRAILAAGAGAAGAVAAMLLDPDRGRARRARVADQAAAVGRRGISTAERTVRRARAAIEGRLEAARLAGTRVAPIDDVSLAAKAATELFRDPEVPKGAININVERAVVVLRGEVPTDEMRQALEERAAAIDGVWSVRNLLHLPDESAPDAEVLAASR